MPLCLSQNAAPHTSGPTPKVTRIVHYTHEITIAAPSLTSAALLAMTVRAEAVQDNSPLPAQALTLPLNREAANALGVMGKTLEDVREFHYNVRTRFLEKCTVGTADSSNRIIDSTRHDEDWYRLVSCHDPWGSVAHMRGKVYTLGSMSGTWDGRLLVFTPHYVNHF